MESPALISSLLLEVSDLVATEAFYGPIFRDAEGGWERQPQSLIFRSPQQTIEFVRRSRPRTTGTTAQHQAYRVRAARLHPLLDELRGLGYVADWWREDGPGEREPHAYLLDPAGNRVQLVPSPDPALFLDHVAVEVVDLDYAEDYYVKGLGGAVEAYPGWTTDGGAEIRAWLEGDDPCAPWTRYTRFSFRSRTVEAHVTPQLFIQFGGTRLAIFLARKHHQQPPEEVLRGTPRIVLRSRESASQWAAHLAGPARAMISVDFRGRRFFFEQEERNLFLRDPGGNYVQIACAQP